MSSTDELDAAYDPKVTIYVEGQTDEWLFGMYWFGSQKNRMPRLDFKRPQAAAIVNGDGCSAVKKTVQARRDLGERVCGLLDRDALTKTGPMAAFVDPNDATFSPTPFGVPYIRVLTRWEVENYLVLDLEILAEELSNFTFGAAADVPAAASRALKIAEILKPLSAAIIACRSMNPAPPLKYMFGKGAATAADMAAQLTAYITKSHPAHLIAFQAAYPTRLVEVHAFDDVAAVDEERWRKVNRILDGKRLIHDILAPHGASTEQQETFCVRIAKAIEKANKIDPEITKAIDEFSALA